MFSKILVAIERSAVGKHIFDEALALAKAMNSSLMLLHVLSPLEEGYPTPVFPGVDGVYTGVHRETVDVYLQQFKQLEQQGLTWLQALATEATDMGIATEFSQNLGDPGRMICEIARNWQADLIVVGRHGRTGLSEWLLGSVSNYVLHHAPCSVLTLQGQIKPETELNPQAEVAMG